MSDMDTPETPGRGSHEIVNRLERGRSGTMRGILAALLMVLAVVLVAGCGGSSNDATGTTVLTDTSSVDTTSSTETTASGDTTSTGDTTSSGGVTAGCQKVADLGAEFSKALGAAGATGGGQADLATIAKTYEAFAEKVPEEIRPAFRTLAAAFAKYAVILKGVDLSSGKPPDAKTIAKLAVAAKALNTQSLTEANAQVSAWAQKNCNSGP